MKTITITIAFALTSCIRVEVKEPGSVIRETSNVVKDGYKFYQDHKDTTTKTDTAKKFSIKKYFNRVKK